MNILMKTKLFWVSLFFLFLGIIFLVMEDIFFGSVDQNGVIQESFFLPMGALSLLLGVMGLVVSIIRLYLKGMKKT